MLATTKPSTKLLAATRDRLHSHCVVCGRPALAGLGLEFCVQADGSVVASFDCDENFEGYGGMLHGGVISAIADGAMTNCLFAHGITAVTAELNVRFRHSIELGRELKVTARITRRTEPLFVVEAELAQAGQLKAKATGKFMETS
ncbi:MAG: PaaI family thioesterase [Planctomycetota bacterium]|nr:MAG: PaaI family thioesterase [Planctomycetota bacterium]